MFTFIFQIFSTLHFSYLISPLPSPLFFFSFLFHFSNTLLLCLLLSLQIFSTLHFSYLISPLPSPLFFFSFLFHFSYTPVFYSPLPFSYPPSSSLPFFFILYLANGAKAQSKNFVFKCHRDGNNVHSVNSIDFHHYGTFCTAGSDGTFCWWDKEARYKSVNKYICFK